MKRIFVFALALVAFGTVAAAEVPAAAPADVAVVAPETPAFEDLFLPEPEVTSCVIFNCAEVVMCACGNPNIIADEACDDFNGRLWALGRCNFNDRHCQTTVLLTTC